MSSVSTFLVDDCFWNLLDSGAPAEKTPLLTGLFDGNRLAETLCHRFGLSVEEAEFEITAARHEVQL